MAGRGRGRGGGNPNQIKGATWEFDPEMAQLIDSKPAELYPTHPNLRRIDRFSARERRQVLNYKNLVNEIHRGPLYTQPTRRNPEAPARVFSEEDYNQQYGSDRKADMDPFTGVETYDQRYGRQKNDLPQLKDRPFNKELFPRELWATLEGDEAHEVRRQLAHIRAKKIVMLEVQQEKEKDERMGKKSTLTSAQRDKILQEKMAAATAGVDDIEEEEAEEVEEEEALDDAYEDEDMGGDYDAEQYFDGGEDELEDDGGDEGGNY